MHSSIGGLATADVHHCKSPGTTTKTADGVYVQTMVALAVLPNIRPVRTEVEASFGAAGKPLHFVGFVEVDPPSLVLVWDVAFPTGTPLVEASTRPFQRQGYWLVILKVLDNTQFLLDTARTTALLVKYLGQTDVVSTARSKQHCAVFQEACP